MTAADAIEVRDEITKNRDMLSTLAKFMDDNTDLRNAVSKACGVVDISLSLGRVTGLLDDYDTVLSKALQHTILAEVSMS